MCSNEVFGDPKPGWRKKCYCKAKKEQTKDYFDSHYQAQKKQAKEMYELFDSLLSAFDTNTSKQQRKQKKQNHNDLFDLLGWN